VSIDIVGATPTAALNEVDEVPCTLSGPGPGSTRPSELR
jgi:hypothetical protein